MKKVEIESTQVTPEQFLADFDDEILTGDALALVTSPSDPLSPFILMGSRKGNVCIAMPVAAVFKAMMVSQEVKEALFTFLKEEAE